MQRVVAVWMRRGCRRVTLPPVPTRRLAWSFAGLTALTYALIVLGALVFGKTIGITLFSYCGMLMGFPLPDRMDIRHLVVAGLIAGLGLTVALFVAGQAFSVGSGFQGAAKMGALISSGVALAAIALGMALKVRDD